MKVSENQLSLFDLILPAPEPTKATEPGEFIIWYANMSGKGEHIYSRFADGSLEFAPRKMILDGQAEPVLFNSVDVQVVREKRHARLGKMIWNKKGWYEIEEIWGQALAELYNGGENENTTER